MKPLGDGFIKLIKMIIAPIIFCTVVVGIAGMEDMKKVGKTGGYALLYFEIVSTIALIVGLVIVNVVQPGAGMNVDPATLDTKGIAAYTEPGKMQSTTDFLLNVIPTTVVDAFAKGEILQVLLFAVLFGFALHRFGGRGTLVFDFIEKISHVLFAIVGYHHEGGADRRLRRDGLHDRQVRRRLAAVAGQADGHVLRSPAWSSSSWCSGSIARFHGFSIWKFINYIKEELLIVLGTSSSESVLPRMMAKLENLGVQEVGGRPGHSDRLFVQPRRHVDLPDDGGGVHRAGHQHADDADAAAHAAGGAAADVQGRGRRHRQRLHRAGGHAVGGRRRAGGRAGADPRHRPLHVRGARADQPDRQRRRHGGGGQVDRRPRRGAHAAAC